MCIAGPNNWKISTNRLADENARAREESRACTEEGLQLVRSVKCNSTHTVGLTADAESDIESFFSFPKAFFSFPKNLSVGKVFGKVFGKDPFQ